MVSLPLQDETWKAMRSGERRGPRAARWGLVSRDWFSLPCKISMWNNKEYGSPNFKLDPLGYYEDLSLQFGLYNIFNSTGCYKQWYVAGSYLTRGSLRKRQWLDCSVCSCDGVNDPAMANVKLPMQHYWMWIQEEGYRVDSPGPTTAGSTSLFIIILNTVMLHLLTGICPEELLGVCVNIIECAYTNLDDIAYCTPRRYGIAYCS